MYKYQMIKSMTSPKNPALNWSRGLFLDFQQQRKYSEWLDTMDPIRSKIVKEQLRQENILLYMFASTLKKKYMIWRNLQIHDFGQRGPSQSTIG